MTRLEQIGFLVDILLSELPEYREQVQRFAPDADSRRRLLRSLMNVRPPLPLKAEFLAVQDKLLAVEREEKGIVDANSLFADGSNFALWQGDITRLDSDAIVNAANSAMLGCFHPCHGCIDNAIHSAAGLQLRDECARIMEAQGHEEPTGAAKITGAYNLPCRHVLHTVGPIVFGELADAHREQLASCYRSCLELAREKRLATVAFCCISTGEFRFPNEEAARIAVETVKSCADGVKVIFNVFKDKDYGIYQRLLG